MTTRRDRSRRRLYEWPVDPHHLTVCSLLVGHVFCAVGCVFRAAGHVFRAQRRRFRLQETMIHNYPTLIYVPYCLFMQCKYRAGNPSEVALARLCSRGSLNSCRDLALYVHLRATARRY